MKKSFQISLMLNNSDTSIIDVKSVPDLSDLITKHDWSPSIYSESRRLVANFVSCEVIGLDVDEGMSLSEAMVIFEPYAHIIAPSKSHQIPR